MPRGGRPGKPVRKFIPEAAMSRLPSVRSGAQGLSPPTPGRCSTMSLGLASRSFS